MEFKLTKTARGKPCIVIGNFKYYLKREKAGGRILSWCCTRKFCKSMVETDPSKTIILKERNEHNHRVCNNLETLDKSDMHNIWKVIHNLKMEQIKKSPKSRMDLHNQIEEFNPITCKFENFCLLNNKENGMIIISCESNLRIMCNEFQNLFADGTFEYLPPFHKKFYTINGYFNGNFVPLVYAFLSETNFTSYFEFFSSLKFQCQQLNLKFEPKNIFIEFNSIIIQAVRNVLPNSFIKCCTFHFKYKINEILQNFNFDREVKEPNDMILSNFLNNLFGLAYLSPNEVSEAFYCFHEIRENNDKRIGNFFNFIQSTFIHEKSTFPPNLWAEEPSINSIHSLLDVKFYHSVYNTLFKSLSKNILVFIKALIEIQTTVYKTMENLHSQPSLKRKNDKHLRIIVQQFHLYKMGKVSRFLFIKSVGQHHKLT